jgi:hypothetical protein
MQRVFFFRSFAQSRRARLARTEAGRRRAEKFTSNLQFLHAQAAKFCYSKPVISPHFSIFAHFMAFLLAQRGVYYHLILAD